MSGATKLTVKNMMGEIMQVLYVVFLGIILAVFFGLGVDAFYPTPKFPEYPASLSKATNYDPNTGNTTWTDDQLKAQSAYEAATKSYDSELRYHNQNASMVVIALSVLALTFSLTLLTRWEVIANGVLLSGIFTLGYSVVLGMSVQDSKFRFLLITIGALVALALGYVKFIRKVEE